MELQKEINSLQSGIIAHKTYLKETDYKAIKEAETGEAMLSLLVLYIKQMQINLHMNCISM